jgi:hypothetical protein
MNHVAVDLGSKQSQVCLRSPEGKVLREERVPNRGLQNFFKEIPQSRVVLERARKRLRWHGLLAPL